MNDDPTGAIGFCHRVRPRLVGTLSLLCGDGDAAEELAQETLARVWLHWSRVRELGEPLATAWTYRVAINLANSWLRRRMAERRARTRLGARVAGVHIDPDPADAIAIRRAVAALPGDSGPPWCCATTRTCRSPRSRP
jgi:DNA-directed RNA polymerase specialized sigma24 family protein